MIFTFHTATSDTGSPLCHYSSAPTSFQDPEAASGSRMISAFALLFGVHTRKTTKKLGECFLIEAPPRIKKRKGQKVKEKESNGVMAHTRALKARPRWERVKMSQ